MCFSLIRNYSNGCVIRDYNGTGFFQYGIFVSVSDCYEELRQYFVWVGVVLGHYNMNIRKKSYRECIISIIIML